MAAASGWPIDLAFGGFSARVHSLVAGLCRPDQSAGCVHRSHLHVVAIGGPRSKRRKFVHANGGDGGFYLPQDFIFRTPWGANVLGAKPEAAGLVVLLWQ